MITINILAFTMKTDFGNMSERGKFKLKNRLKPTQNAHFEIFDWKI